MPYKVEKDMRTLMKGVKDEDDVIVMLRWALPMSLAAWLLLVWAVTRG